MKDHRRNALSLSSLEKQARKNSGLNRILNSIRTHDLCDTGAALLPTELSSQLWDGVNYEQPFFFF